MQKRINFAQYIGFIAIGMVSSIYGPMISTIRQNIPMNYQETGLILSSRSLGMLLIVILSSLFIEKVGIKKYLLCGGAFLFLGLVGNALSGQYAFLFVSTLIIGLGYGMYEVGINALRADSSHVNPGRAMNYLHFFFSAGVVLGPLLATISLNAIKSWRFGFLGLAILPLVTSIQFASLQPYQSSISTPKKDNPFRYLFLWFLGITVFMYVGIEAAIYNWLPVFWETTGKDSSFPSSLTTSIYGISVTIGRVLLGSLPDRLGFSRCLVLTALCSIIIMVGCCFLPGSTLPLVGLLGLVISIVFPVIMAWGTSSFSGWVGQISSFFFIFSPLGGFLVPAYVGKVADSLGIEVLPFVILILVIGLFIFSLLAWRLSPMKKYL